MVCFGVLGWGSVVFVFPETVLKTDMNKTHCGVIFYWNILDIRAVPLLHGKRLSESAKKCDNLCNSLPQVTWKAHFYAIQLWENCILAYFTAPFPLILSDLPFRTRNLYKSSMKGAKKWKRLRNKRCKATEGNIMSEMCGKCHFSCSAGF